jgi:hypothetical protein
MLTGMLATTGGIALAANPAANLDQCANFAGVAPNQATNCSASDLPAGSNNWVNGNLGQSKALYHEGDSVPYRMRFSNLALVDPVSHTPIVHKVTIEWDTTKSSKHALDYITTYNRTVAGADPCLQVVPACGPMQPYGAANAIPADGQVTGAGVTPIAGNLTIFGGAITNISAYSYSTGTGFTGDKSASLQISFTASQGNPVLAWGGHIATRQDWGPTASAVSIPGSPYHMRLLDLDGAGGNQDRSLTAAAVIFPGSITIIKDAVPNSLQDFSFTDTGGLTPALFILDDDSGVAGADNVHSNTQAFPNLQVASSATYTFTETPVGNWTQSFQIPVCTVSSGNGGTQSGNASTHVLTVNLSEGENVTCTFVNTHTFNSTGLTTTTSPSSGSIGTTLADSATLTGATSGAGGTISFYLFAPGVTCNTTGTGAVYSSTGVPVSGNGTYQSSAGTTKTGSASAASAGTYHWVAVYSGDGNNNGTDSGCTTEPVVISPNTTHLSTTPSETTGSIGDTLTDTATLTGATTGATGTIDFYLFAPGASCDDTAPITGFVYSATGVPVSGNSTYSSANATGTTGSNVTTAAGTYTWVAVYTDGADNVSSKSSCGSEDVVIGPNTTGLSTTPSETTGKIGDTLSDSATLTGATTGAGGTISFYLFAPGATCDDTAPITGFVYSSTGVPVSGNNTYASSAGTTKTGSAVTTGAGTYTWVAVYSGDGNNTGSKSGCGSEDVVIGPNSPTLGTTPDPASGKIGDPLGDSADLSGETSDATGNITFWLFAPGDDCSNTSTAVYTEVVASSGGSAATTGTGTGNNTATQAGTYHWAAHYAGDANNNSADSACGAEPVTIAKNTPGVATTPNLLPNDQIHLTGLTSNATGSLYVELQIDAACGAPNPAYTKTWDNGGVNDAFTGNGFYDTDNKTVFVTADHTIRWCTSYSGDGNNSKRALADDNEVIAIDFFPIGTAAAFGFAVPMFLWGLRNRKKRNAKD